MPADFVGANRDEVALAEGQTDISGAKLFTVVKNPG